MAGNRAAAVPAADTAGAAPVEVPEVKKPTTSSDAEWLRYTGVRADEFTRRARLKELPEPPQLPEDSEGMVHRRRLLTDAGTGLNYDAAAAKSSESEHAVQSLAYRNAVASSFCPQRHVFYVLGRPCLVPRRKTIIRYFWLPSTLNPPPEASWNNLESAEKNGYSYC